MPSLIRGNRKQSRKRRNLFNDTIKTYLTQEFCILFHPTRTRTNTDIYGSVFENIRRSKWSRKFDVQQFPRLWNCVAVCYGYVRNTQLFLQGIHYSILYDWCARRVQPLFMLKPHLFAYLKRVTIILCVCCFLFAFFLF